MRHIRMVMFIIDSDNPQADLNSALNAGATANGYSYETFTIESNVDAYIRFRETE